MNHTAVMHNNLPMPMPAHYSPRYGCLTQGGVKAFSGLEGEMIHCNAGNLWVTFEGDTKDYILHPGDHLPVPNQGRTLVSGPGCYRISKSLDGLDLIAAA